MGGLAGPVLIDDAGVVNLHDWIDELCDTLDLDVEIDEALLLDLARDVAHNVERRAAPISTFMLGYAAGAAEANPEQLEQLAARAQALALAWDRPAGAPDPTDAVEVPVPDDSGVDHTADLIDAD